MRIPRWSAIAVVATATLAAQLPGLGSPERFDDTRFVTLNPRVQSAGRLGQYVLDPSADVPGIQLPDYPYRPVAEASFLVVDRLGGGIRAQRGVNLIIHALSSVLVWMLLRRLLAGDPSGEGIWALLGACWFALHPLGVQAVTYVTQRSVSLMTLLGLLASWAYLRVLHGGGFRWRILAWSALALALGTKESAVAIPLWLGLLEWLASPATGREGRLRRWLPLAVLVLLVPLQVARLSFARGWESVQPGRKIGWWEGPFVQARAFQNQLGLHLFPFQLSLFSGPNPGRESAALWLSLALLFGLVSWVLWGPSRHRLLRLGAGWLLAPQLPELLASGYVFHHRCYPGLAGGGLLFAWTMSRVRWGRTLAALVVLALGVQTVHESLLWKSGLSERDTRCAPGLQKNRLEIPWKVLRRGDAERAARLFKGVSTLPSASPSCRIGFARALEQQGGRRKALEFLQTQLDAGEPDYFQEAARLAWLEGEREAALRFASRAAEKRPWDGGVGLAQLWVSWGYSREAEALMRTAVLGLPRYAQAWENLGIALSRQERLSEAEDACRRAVRLGPDIAETHNDLASVLALQGRFPEAEGELREAVRLRPSYAMAWKNLALLLGQMGRPEETASAEGQARACPPDLRLLVPP